MVLYINQRNEVSIEAFTNGQAFSGTDLNKDPDKDTGIVFPLANPSNQVSVSSIIDHREGKVRLAHCEARIANQEGDDTIYRKGLALAIVLDDPNLYPDIPVSQQLFGVQKTTKDYVVTSDKGLNVMDINSNKNLAVIIESFRNLNYKPDTSFVFEYNLEKKPLSIAYYTYGKDKQQLFDYADEVEVEEDQPKTIDKDVSLLQKVIELNTFFRNANVDVALATVEAFKKRNQKAREAYFKNIMRIADEFDVDLKTTTIYYAHKDFVKAYELAIDAIYKECME